MSANNALSDHRTFATLLQSHPFIDKTYTENIHNNHLHPNILLSLKKMRSYAKFNEFSVSFMLKSNCCFY